MPVTPVMPSKLSVPEPPAGYLPRERLDRQWREWEQKRLVLVTAGPGYGKTSFLAANARSAGEVCIWLSLDETDGELGSFRAHLDRGLLGAVAGTGMRGASSPSTVSGGLPHEGANEALVRWVQALRDRQRHTYLILDDAHLVTYSPEVIQILGRLIRFLPDTTTMVVASREPLDLAIMKLRSAGRGGMLTAPDLAFTSREVAQLFGRRFQQASLPPRLAREVVARTEGWAAGIEIFFQVLDGVSPRAIEDALASIESAGTSWFAYFAEEVISRLTPETQDFLYRSSVLPRLDGELCDRLLGRRDSLRILNQLRRRNLFTFPCGTGSRSLRYHHLFREFLQDRLRRTLPRADRQKLQRRAARALVKEGAWVDAVRAYAEAGDSEGALRLIERMGDNLLATGQHQALREAFGFIPPTKLRGRHMAQFVLGRLCELQGDWEEADRIFRRILRASRPGGRRAELLRLLATQKVRWGDYRACAALCRRALKEPGLRRSPVRGLLQSLLGVAHCELGDLDEGQRHLEAAAEAFRKNGNSWEQGRNYYLRAANVHYFRGEFRRAKDTARRALAIFRKLGDRRQISHSLGVLAFVTAGAGETHEARELAHQGLRLAESFDYRDLIGYCHLTLGRCALLAGDLAEACEHFEVAREYGEATGEADLRVFSRMGLAECALRRANPSAARKAVTETLSIARGMHDRLQEGQCHFFLGLAVHGSDPRRARSEWDRAEAILRRTGARFELHRLLLARLAEDETAEARYDEMLSELITGIATSEHAFLLSVIEPERGAKALAQALRRDVQTAYVSQLLVQLGQPAVPHIVPLTEESSPAIQARAVKLLAQLGGEEAQAALQRMADATTQVGRKALRAAEELDRTPGVALHIRALGPLTVSIGDRVVRYGDWRSARALRLFQLLLIHRFHWVPRDVVLELLWPDAEPEKAGNSLRQTIHVLRRSLEPDLQRPSLSRYIHFRNEACRLDPGPEYRFDVEELETALSESERLWNGGKQRKAEPQLRRAMELYEGEFLAECPYEEFAADTREDLRAKLLRCMRRLMELLVRAKRWEEVVPVTRRALTVDSYQEVFYEGLVEALLRLGNRREALASYHRYEEMMVQELGLLPSARMKAMADRVVLLGKPKAGIQKATSDPINHSGGQPVS